MEHPDNNWILFANACRKACRIEAKLETSTDDITTLEVWFFGGRVLWSRSKYPYTALVTLGSDILQREADEMGQLCMEYLGSKFGDYLLEENNGPTTSPTRSEQTP